MAVASDIIHHSVKCFYDISPGLSAPDFDIPFPTGVAANERCRHCGSYSLEKYHWHGTTYRKCMLCEREQ